MAVHGLDKTHLAFGFRGDGFPGQRPADYHAGQFVKPDILIPRYQPAGINDILFGYRLILPGHFIKGHQYFLDLLGFTLRAVLDGKCIVAEHDLLAEALRKHFKIAVIGSDQAHCLGAVHIFQNDCSVQNEIPPPFSSLL